MKNDYSTSYRRYGNETDEKDDDADLEENLMHKTSKLKQITISLGNEIRDSNKLLNGLDADFDKSKNFLDYTLNRVNRLSKSGNCKMYFYLILFCLFVFLCLYVVIKWF
jgi:blocked-early-in-transport protein 1